MVLHVSAHSHEMRGAKNMHADAVKITLTETVCVVAILLH